MNLQSLTKLQPVERLFFIYNACLSPSLDQEEEWEPTEENCAELYKDWGWAISAQPGDRFLTDNAAAISGLMQLALRSDFGSLESGFGIYIMQLKEGGFLGFGRSTVTRYSFTKITTGSRGTWDPRNYSSYNGEFMARSAFNTLVGWGHSHPRDKGQQDGFSWRISSTAYTGEVVMRGDMIFEGWGSKAFLIGDDLRMLYEYPRNFDNTFINRDAAEMATSAAKPIGISIPGAPSADTMKKVIACRQAGEF